MKVVHKSYFLPFDQLSQWPESQVGELGYHLGKLTADQVRIAPGLIVPRDTLLAIAQANQLDHQLFAWAQQVLNGSESAPLLRQLMHQLHIPAEISQTFLDHYYQVLRSQPVAVAASWLNPQYGHLLANSSEVVGDSNAFSALLDTWAQSIELTLQPEHAAYMSLQHTVPAALLIQASLTPQLRGTVVTDIQTKNTYQIDVEIPQSGSQVLTASILIDTRSWQIRELKLPESVTADQLADLLPATQALEIAQLAYQIKVHQLHPVKVTWEQVDGQIYVSNVERMSEPEEQSEPWSAHDPHCLALGHTLVRGEIEAKAVVQTTPLLTHQTFDHQILVVPTLTHLSMHNLIGLAGVISERDLPWAVHQFLLQQHIPTLVRTQRATQAIKNGQLIKFDTATGKIFSVTAAAQVAPQKSEIKVPRHQIAVWVSQNSEELVEKIPAKTPLIFNFERWWLETGLHPRHILKTPQSQTLQAQMTGIITSYRNHQGPLVFRPSTLRTDQLLALQHSSQFETLEPNPALGFRGAIRLLQQTEMLEFELHLIEQLQKTLERPIAILIPETRTIAELKKIMDKCRAHHLTHIWWEMAFPINIDQAPQLPMDRIDKVIIKTDQLLSYYQGLDREQPDLLVLYPREMEVLQRLLGRLIRETDHRKILLEVQTDFQALIETCLQVGLSGIVTSVRDYHTARNAFLAAETELDNRHK